MSDPYFQRMFADRIGGEVVSSQLFAEFKRYLDISLGSLGELDNHLRLALDL
jgi:hypothetical protein